MTAIAERINGRLLRTDQGAAILLQEGVGVIYLRYALVGLSGESLIFPEALLDDWGRELKTLELYAWIRQHGLFFPRAEVFGFDGKGEARQCFLRELDLHARPSCWAFQDKRGSLHSGLLIEHVIQVNLEILEPEEINRPADVPMPLRQADVTWWQANPELINEANVVVLGGR